jgi:heterodisulfide reductase subunit A-like polyferredoxin
MTVTHNPLALRPSLYADTAVPPVAAPPLETDRTVSVAIIGGGFAGLSTALHLAGQGTDAIVLEAQEPGWAPRATTAVNSIRGSSSILTPSKRPSALNSAGA